MKKSVMLLAVLGTATILSGCVYGGYGRYGAGYYGGGYYGGGYARGGTAPYDGYYRPYNGDRRGGDGYGYRRNYDRYYGY